MTDTLKIQTFTPEELAEMAEFDAEIDAEGGWLNADERALSAELERQAKRDRLDEADAQQARCRAYYDQHRDELLDYSRAYYRAHREKISARSLAYYHEHKAEIAKRRKAYYEARKEEALAYQRAYDAAHRDEINARERAKRRRKRHESKP